MVNGKFGDQLGEGAYHTVYSRETSDYVRKIPKGNLTTFNALEGFNYMMSNLGEFMPQTRFVIQSDGSYIVFQKKINGKQLNELSVNEIDIKILSQLLTLLTNVSTIASRDSVYIDLLGPLDLGEGFEHKSSIAKQVYLLIKMKDVLVSSNIMVDENGKVFLVDNVGEKRFFNGIRKYNFLVLLKVQEILLKMKK